MVKNTKEEVINEEDYICIECGTEKKISSTEPILCRNCQKRVFRKIRVKENIQHIAR
jgi:DNA-directed RNA polymerase subunit RPC12/RpoP